MIIAMLQAIVLFILVFQIIYNAVIAGTAKLENDGFLLNCLLSAIVFFAYLVEVVK